MEVLLISGKAGHGKDTFAEILQEQLTIRGKKVIIIHFADLVKEFAKLYYNWNGEKNTEGRALLQYIGTDLMRKFDIDYWARIVGEFLAAADKDFEVALIPDTRFPNEIEVIKSYCPQAKTIRIQRWNADNSEYINPMLTNTQKNHISETGLDDYQFDYLINNYSEDMNCLIKSATGMINSLTFNKK